MDAVLAYGNVVTADGTTVQGGAGDFVATLPVQNIAAQHLTKVARTSGQSCTITVVAEALTTPRVLVLGNTSLSSAATLQLSSAEAGTFMVGGASAQVYRTRPPATEFTDVKAPGGTELRAAVAVQHSSIWYDMVFGISPLTKLRSSDGGETWADPSGGAEAGGTGATWFRQTNGTDTLVLVGNGQTTYQSTDAGANWNNGTLPGSPTVHGVAGYRNAADDAGRCVAVGVSGGNAAMYVSTDGITWAGESGVNPAGTLRAVAGRAGGVAVAVGDNGLVMRSPSYGAAWEQVTVASAAGVGLKGVAVSSGGLFVMVGAGGRLWTSADGSQWVERNTGLSVDLTAVAAGTDVAGGDVYYATGLSGRGLYSSNGLVWRPRTLPTANATRCVAFNPGGANQTPLVAGTLKLSPERRLAMYLLSAPVEGQQWVVQIADLTQQRFDIGFMLLAPWVQPQVTVAAPLELQMLDRSVLRETLGSQLLTYEGAQQLAVEPGWDALVESEANAQFLQLVDRLSGTHDHVFFCQDPEASNWSDTACLGRIRQLGPASQLGPEHFGKRYRIEEAAT